MIEVIFYKNKQKAPYTEKNIKKIVFLVCAHEKILKGSIEISLVSIQDIKHINNEYRSINKPTDVISFKGTEKYTKRNEFILPFVKAESGFIYICPLYIKKQAQRFKVSYKEEFARMLVHGVLHVAGHDHVIKKEAQKMFKLQESIVKKLE